MIVVIPVSSLERKELLAQIISMKILKLFIWSRKLRIGDDRL